MASPCPPLPLPRAGPSGGLPRRDSLTTITACRVIAKEATLGVGAAIVTWLPYLESNSACPSSSAQSPSCPTSESVGRLEAALAHLWSGTMDEHSGAKESCGQSAKAASPPSICPAPLL